MEILLCDCGNSIWPSCGLISPAIKCNSVVLPEPEGAVSAVAVSVWMDVEKCEKMGALLG